MVVIHHKKSETYIIKRIVKNKYSLSFSTLTISRCMLNENVSDIRKACEKAIDKSFFIINIKEKSLLTKQNKTIQVPVSKSNL